ncbi:hypothetical protein TNCV_4006411 [Trichonephila clavipes]|nr:hypothetical protein TNCV_4006411 [Trichonephila clavipes]
MIVQFRNEKVSNHGSIPITIYCNFVAFIVFEEGFHQPIKRTKQSVFLDVTVFRHTLVEVVDLARQINLEADNDDVQELLDSHYQEQTMDELIEMHEQKQDIELESLVQSKDRMTVGNSYRMPQFK